jgi:hypothetical protein
MSKHKPEFTKCPFCHGDANAFVGGNSGCDCHGTGLMELEPGVGARRLVIDVERSIFGITYAPITEIDPPESKASAPLAMGTKVFAATQTTEDLKRLEMVYEAAPLLPGKPS